MEELTEGERRVLGAHGETIVTEGDLFNASLDEYEVVEHGSCQHSSITGDPLFADIYGVVVTDDGGPEVTEK